jgi:pimeloyl-ACP methyl ester carboxylesterase
MLMSRKCFITIVFLLFCNNVVYAETVSLKTAKDIYASAEYQPGDADKPLLIFIHGFLQTSSFSTVARLYEALRDSGFPVLSPTLSLGVSNRAQALPCESIHLHSLNSDTDEIDQWVRWAIAHGHKEIVLIGHSAGSVNITAFLAQNTHPEVKKTILISLSYFGPGRAAAFETEQYAQKARDMLKRADNGLEKFALSFCKDYVTTPENYLSYYDWSDKQVLKAIKVNTSENYIIFGSADDRIGKKWVSELQKVSGKIIVIDGASHFFDQSHEFDLLDNVEKILNGE